MNHSLFRSGTPSAGDRLPSGLLAAAIERDFGGLVSLGTRFAASVDELTGAAWVWLVSSQDQDGTLQVLSTGPHVLPLLEGYDTLLQRHVAAPARPWIDRHARAAALSAWWRRVNWAQVGRCYEHTSRLHRSRRLVTTTAQPASKHLFASSGSSLFGIPHRLRALTPKM